jgi:hypothetical protein
LDRTERQHPSSRGGGVQHHSSFAEGLKALRTCYEQLIAHRKTGQHLGTIGTLSDRPAPPPIAGSPDINGDPIEDQASWYGWSDRTLSLHWLVE